MMKTKKLFLLLAMLLMSLGIYAQNTEFETAAEAVKNMKIGINCLSFELDSYNYRYSNDRNWKTEWEWVGQNAAELPKMLRNAGYNTMRLMIPWRRFMDSSGKIDTQWMAHVRECVDYVIDQGMYCTISNLFDTGEEGRLIYSEEENYNEYKELFEYFWVQVAEEFKDYDHHLIFEGWNEMLDRYGWEGNPNGYANPEQFEPLNEYAQSFVNAVRSTGGNNSYRNLLINTFGACGGIEGDGDWIPALSYFKVPNDKNIGHIFVGIHAYYDVTDMNALAEFDNCMTKWRKWSESNAVPIILGELGLLGMVRDYFEHPEDTKNFWRHIVQSCRLNNIIPFVILWSPLGTYRQMPAFDVPDLHKAILKGYYGEDYEPRMLTDEDYNVWISFKPENTICWMWTDLLETNMYKGFLFEIENYPGDGLLDMHIGNGENFVIKPISSASTFFEFTPDEVGNDAGAIFIEYKGNEPYTMKVKRIVMQKRDGREFAFAAPIWIQRHDPNGWMGPNFESKRKQFVHTVGFDHLWAELNLFDDEIPLKLRNYKGIRVEFAEPINVDDFGIKVYADNGAVEEGRTPNSSTSATILFSDFPIKEVVNRITLQYGKESKGEAKVISAWLIRQDDTEEYSDLSPFWGCEITNMEKYVPESINSYTYTVNEVVNGNVVRSTKGEGTPGSEITVPYHRYNLLNGKLYLKDASGGPKGLEYNHYFTLTENNQVETINYEQTDIQDVVFFAEGEDIPGMTLCDNDNMRVRSSNCLAAYVADGSVGFVTLPAGSYRLTAFIHNSYKDPDSYWKFLAGDKEIANLHCTVVNIQELQSEVFTLNEKTTLYIPQCGDERSGIDLLYITKEKEAEPVTITADDKTMTYGDKVPTLTYTISGAALNGTPSLSTTATKASPVGTYTIKVEQGTVTNENVIYVDGTLTIEKADLTVGVEDVTITEGDAIPSFILTYSGFRNGDTESKAFTTKPKATTTATAYSKAGTYPITVSGGKATNYALNYTQGTLTIEPASGIEGVYADGQGNAVIFNINGQKLSKPKKGINIIGGKKVVVK